MKHARWARAAATRRLCATVRTRTRWVVQVCAPVIGAAGCADLLGLPQDPQLAMPAAPESPTQKSPLGTVPANRSSADAGQVMSGAPPDRGSADAGTAAISPQRDRAGDRADAGGSAPGSVGVEEPTPEASFDAGPDAPDSADAGAIEPVCEGGAVEGPNGNCYGVDPSEMGWVDAAAACRERGAGWDLAAVHDAETNEFLAGLFRGEAWLGGSDANVEGQWVWVRDGVEFWSGDATGGPVNDAFANWNSDEPNGDDTSDCMRMVAATTRWADLECEELRRALCEGPPIAIGGRVLGVVSPRRGAFTRPPRALASSGELPALEREIRRRARPRR